MDFILLFIYDSILFILTIIYIIIHLLLMGYSFASLIGLLLVTSCIYSFEILTTDQRIEQIQSFSEGSEQILKDIINTTQRLWPLPKRFSGNTSSQLLEFDITDISFKIQSLSDNVQSIVNHYILNVFKINPQTQRNKSLNNASPITLSIVVKSSKQILPQSTQHQKFQLTIRQNEKWELICDYFPGFVRGFQTFSQLLQKQPNGRYIIRNRPVLIDDEPDYRWRGLMIDTSRHYLPVSQITKIIDGLMYNKMNVLHWHIIDQDSFPMQVQTRPELSQFGSLAGVYSLKDLKYIFQYASDRAIRIIPEYDSPAHTRSWGRSPQLANITLDGQLPFQGQFNPIINLTYEVMTDVIKYVNSVFSDRYVHLGGDQVDPDVWDQHPEIKEWMKINNISNYDQLQVYYRKKQRQILRSVNSTKKAIYWANQQINLPVDQQDVIQWWGDTENLDQIKTRKSQIILSNYDLAYLDVGFGDELGDPYQTHISWRDMYAFKGKIEGVNIIGGQACMWSELTYKGNIQQKVWIRSSIIAERLWNENIDIKVDLLNIVKRLIEQRKRMQQRGYKCSPVTVGLCEKDPSICFN